ncbi:DUF2510 domain-containing protein [Cryobacterium algoritolerans]|uniref:DUF2510 domain-containing protein n=1 Tax=Cryobacterium algoritolerans TaxID=1259184 RepID=A0A4V3IEX6_9MICO|nr:DUF2510 domain-containing protein [Cryobacterium algoritolerans]TFC15209.1 DUF2510 domain-containing protein [Cryobacterium algoritolerans]
MDARAGYYDDGNNQMRWWDDEHWTGAVRENSAPHPKVAESETRDNVEQILWVVFHWLGTMFAALLALAAVPAFSTQPSVTVAVIAGLFASTGSSVMATRLAREHLPSHEFIRGTTTSRSVTGAWVLIIGGYLVATVVGGVLHLASGIGGALGGTLDEGIAVAFLGLGTLLAMLGPGYSEYRDARVERTFRLK